MSIDMRVLEQKIKLAVEELVRGCHEDESFAVYEARGVQVQIKVTKNEDDFFDELHPAFVACHDKAEQQP